MVGILDWGLGHASRMVPILQYLLQFQCQILVAATGPQKKLLEAEFPHLNFLTPPAYDVRYNGKKNLLIFDLFRQLPRLIRVIRHEKKWVEEVVQKYQVDAIISDNRYGFRSNSCYSVFITHQIRPKTGISGHLDRIIEYLHLIWIRKFDTCWVPDAPGSLLSGELSGSGRLPRGCVFIGPLSRFAGRTVHGQPGGGLLVLLSGPEPNRSILEELLVSQLSAWPGEYTLVRGLPGHAQDIPQGINHLPAGAMSEAVINASAILCRSGYTSIMDLMALGKTAILIPTPGQTEQEYLARTLANKGYFLAEDEAGFQLTRAMDKLKDFRPLQPELNFFQFRVFIDRLFLQLKQRN